MAGDDSMVESRGEDPLRFGGRDCGFFGRNCRFETKCFSFLRERIMRGLPASQFYIKSNVRGGTRRLPMRNKVSQNRPSENGRGRTHSHPMREGRAPENKSSDAVTLSNREGAGGFSKRRERERRRTTTMIVTRNKSAEFCIIQNRGR